MSAAAGSPVPDASSLCAALRSCSASADCSAPAGLLDGERLRGVRRGGVPSPNPCGNATRAEADERIRVRVAAPSGQPAGYSPSSSRLRGTFIGDCRAAALGNDAIGAPRRSSRCSSRYPLCGTPAEL